MIRITIGPQRAAGTQFRLVTYEHFLIATLVGLDSFSYLFHAFASRAPIAFGVRVIDKLVGCIRLLKAFLMTLVPVELIVLYIGGNLFFFHPLIVLFPALTNVRPPLFWVF